MMGRSGERGADDMDTEEDTVDDEGDSEDVRGGQRSYFRSGSESSLSCQGALEHEVHVQIEEPTQESRDERKGEDPKAVPLRKKGRSRPVCYDNSGYSPDLEEGEIHGELVHEIDGAKTYRSATTFAFEDFQI
nr:hypothetical protein BaRGS_030203 [Batillaria attramentaria]